MNEQTKNNNKDYYIRLLREINNGVIDFKKVRKTTIDKYKIEYNDEQNKYISKLWFEKNY